MKSIKYILLICVFAGLSSCFKDKGNYDYSDVNEVVIGGKGFADTVYNVRADIDVLDIAPDLVYTMDADKKHTYTYEWVAVGVIKNQGKRFTIGDAVNLSYDVKLPADTYDLFLKVKDSNTELVFSRSVSLNVSTSYTRGWMLAGEDETAHAVVDMISISRDTLIQRDVVKDDVARGPANIVWTDNHERTTEVHGGVYLSTADGSFMYDRETMAYGEFSNMRDYFVNTDYIDKVVATDMQQVDDKLRTFIIDGNFYRYNISGANTGFFGNPINRYSGSYHMFKIGDKVALNFSGVGAAGVTYSIIYNDEEKCFCLSSWFDEFVTKCVDTESDLTLYSWTTGFDYVKTINSLFASGQSATILKDGSKHYIYTYTVIKNKHTKGARYEVSGATDFDKASFYTMTTRQGYMIYAVGSVLYGYDFRGNNAAVVLKDFSPRVITNLHNDIFSAQRNDDYIYVSTYLDGTARSGSVRKYAFTDSADKIEITEQTDVKWDNLNKIHSIWFKEF